MQRTIRFLLTSQKWDAAEDYFQRGNKTRGRGMWVNAGENTRVYPLKQ